MLTNLKNKIRKHSDAIVVVGSIAVGIALSLYLTKVIEDSMGSTATADKLSEILNEKIASGELVVDFDKTTGMLKVADISTYM